MKISFIVCMETTVYNSKTVVPRYINTCVDHFVNLSDRGSKLEFTQTTSKWHSNQV